MKSRSGRRSAGGMLAILLLVLYWFAQPVLNERFGLNLPGIGSENTPSSQPDRAQPEPEQPRPAPTPEVADSESRGTEVSNSETPDRPAARGQSDDTGLRYGLLREVGRDRYLSPAGLLYTPGSQEGHRLKHLERHLTDQPSRPGPHGVFDGDLEAVLRLLDQAFEKTKSKPAAKGVSSNDEDGRTVHEIQWDVRIGYVGGQTGSRRNKPAATKLRLVVDGNRVITAFPYD